MATCNFVIARDCRLSSTTTECFACGLPACTACSVRLPYERYGRERICYDCITQGVLGGRVSSVAEDTLVSAIRNVREGGLPVVEALTNAMGWRGTLTLNEVGWIAGIMESITELRVKAV